VYFGIENIKNIHNYGKYEQSKEGGKCPFSGRGGTVAKQSAGSAANNREWWPNQD
jgi:hypothetical protein